MLRARNIFRFFLKQNQPFLLGTIIHHTIIGFDCVYSNNVSSINIYSAKSVGLHLRRFFHLLKKYQCDWTFSEKYASSDSFSWNIFEFLPVQWDFLSNHIENITVYRLFFRSYNYSFQLQNPNSHPSRNLFILNYLKGTRFHHAGRWVDSENIPNYCWWFALIYRP